VGLLIKNLLGEVSLGSVTHDQIVAAAEGNPLFVEEMLRMLVDDGLLHREDGRWVTTGDLTEVAIPPSVEALLAARLDRLLPAERALLQRAATIGRTFYSGALVELSPPESREAVPQLLGALLRRQLIDREPDHFFAGEDAYRFNHILSRDAAYASVPKLRRVRLHEAFARWLEARAGERLGEFEEVVGFHLEQAYLYRQSLSRLDDAARALGREACSRLTSAAYRARMRGDVPAAGGLVGRALLMLPEADPLRLELACQHGSDLLDLGELDRAEAVLEEALLQAKEFVGSEALESRIEVELQFVRLQTDPARVMSELGSVGQRAERAFMTSRDERGLARVWQLRSERDWGLCHFADAARALERALVHARRAGDQLLESELLSALGAALSWGPTPAAEGIAWAEEMLASGIRMRRIESGLLAQLGYLRAMQGEFDTARELASRSRAMLEELGLRFAVAARSGNMASIEYLAGDVGAAEAQLRWAYTVLDEVEERGVLPTIAADLAHVLVELERYDEALRFTEVSEEYCDPDDVLSEVSWRSARAKARSWEGRHGEAESLARDAVRLAATTDCLHVHGSALLDLARVLGPERAGERESLIREALSLFERKGQLALAEKARVLLPA
jgi:tetratricopeptide (TPR) repeat protein